MKGSVFREFAKMVEQNFGKEMFDDLVEDCDLANGGSYTSVGYYDDQELLALLLALGRRTKMTFPEVLHAFGKFLVPSYLAKYELSRDAYAGFFDFLDDLARHWRAETMSLYPSFPHPKFEINFIDNQTISVLFQTVSTASQPMPPVSLVVPGILGVLEGVVDYYGASAKVELADGDQLGEREAVFKIRLDVEGGINT